MAILNDNTIPSAPSTPSKEVVLQRVSNRIKNISKETFNQLIQTQRQGITALWENPNVTPQEIIDSLGDDALKVFQFHGALTEFIKGLAQIDNVTVELKYPTNAFTVDKNGKITVTDQPYVQ